MYKFSETRKHELSENRASGGLGNGKYKEVWKRVKELQLNSDIGLAIQFESKKDMENCRSGVLGYAAREKASWKVLTRTDNTPNKLHIFKVNK